MLLLALIVLMFVGATVGLTAWSVILPRTRQVARLNEIGAYGYAGAPTTRSLPGPDPHRQRPLTVLASHLGNLVARWAGLAREERMKAELVAAGLYTTSPRALLGYQLMSAVGMGLLVAAGAPASSLVLNLLLTIGTVGVAWMAPLVFVQRRARLRTTEIDRTLPDLIDQLVVTIEAGLGFSSSLQVTVSRMRGPLGDELRLTLQEQRMGLALKPSLDHMLERAPTPNMRSLVRAINQGESLGVSIGTIMRNLAAEMRVRRRQSAEEQAQKAPVKMLFPLIFFMLPAVGIVILGPAVFSISDALGSL
jgi:tight adherence protein C